MKSKPIYTHWNVQIFILGSIYKLVSFFLLDRHKKKKSGSKFIFPYSRVGTNIHLHLSLFILALQAVEYLFIFLLQIFLSLVLVLCGYVWTKSWSTHLALSSFKQRKRFILLSLVFCPYFVVRHSELKQACRFWLHKPALVI